MEVFFIWKENKLQKVCEIEYRTWLKGFDINQYVKYFGSLRVS